MAMQASVIKQRLFGTAAYQVYRATCVWAGQRTSLLADLEEATPTRPTSRCDRRRFRLGEE